MNNISNQTQLTPTLDQFKIDDKRSGLLKGDGTALVQEIPNFLSEQESNQLIQFTAP